MARPVSLDQRSVLVSPPRAAIGPSVASVAMFGRVEERFMRSVQGFS
ncbi:hypothetical protein RESH_02808 [Rhodopirellula europaea SH398]|uniref:Uncharacterized protein n=1 Tax=Rhodopirellula europaea SH398 TaxID=1263868 RepID=M5S4Q7_9BACT|nr:hypothetical protein RESH_02808 [Rhodopirellula europaea SH398]